MSAASSWASNPSFAASAALLDCAGGEGRRVRRCALPLARIGATRGATHLLAHHALNGQAIWRT